MKAFFIGLCIIFITFGCCSTRRLVVAEIEGPRIELKLNSKTPEELFGVWFNSFEEEKTNAGNIYRPQSFDFPLSRGRSGIEFLQNGLFYELFPGPSDAMVKIEGNWIYTSKTKSIEITFPLKNNLSSPTITQTIPKPYTILVLSVSKEVLKIKKVDN